MTRDISEMKFIVGCVAQAYRMPKESIYKRTRLRSISEPRQVAMHFMRRKGFTFDDIGIFFSMNHATVVHGDNKIWGLMQHDRDLDKKIQEVEELIKGKWRKEKYFEKQVNKYCFPVEINNPLIVGIPSES